MNPWWVPASGRFFSLVQQIGGRVMANVTAVTNFVVGFVIMHASLLVWIAIMAPGTVHRARQRLETRPIASLLWGLGVFSAMLLTGSGLLLLRMQCIGLVSGVLQHLSEWLAVNRLSHDSYMVTHGLGWLLMAPFMICWAFGGAAFAELFASRIRRFTDNEHSVRALVGGAFCTSAAGFLPLVGWFAFLPLVGLMSIGAGTCALLSFRLHPVREAQPQRAFKECELPACAASPAGTTM